MASEIATVTKQLADAIERLVDDIVDERLENMPDEGGEDGDPGPDEPTKPKRPFQPYQIMRYKNQPDLKPLGWKPLKIYYESAFWGNNREDMRTPPRDVITRIAKSAPAMSVLDIERLKADWKWRLDPGHVAQLVDIAKTYRAGLKEGSKFGYYTLIPARSLIEATAGEGSAPYQHWQSWNDRTKPIAEVVDFTCPSLYTFKTDQAEWMEYAEHNIKEAKRVSNGKDCFPFLWPQFHDTKNIRGLKNKPIPADFFRVQLETCRRFADGVVIWTLSDKRKVEFSDIPPWWDSARDFGRSLL